MAKSVSEVREIELLDGTEVTLRPASITVLKKIMKVIGKMSSEVSETDLENAGDHIMDILVEASAVALEKQLPDSAGFVKLDPVKDKSDYDAMRERYEELVDMNIVNLVNSVCGGINFDDPNLAAAREAAGTN
jgi:hypothetical protein